MRCRRTRSFLSAYCNDELPSSRKLAISEHLSTCPECRREETEFRALVESAQKVPSLKVSADFTNKLFNRIAEERFAETRSKAYLPKPAPLVRWTVLVPAVATACIVALVGIMTLAPGNNDPAGMIAANDDTLPRHLTVQPTHNPNMTVSLEKDWSLAAQMARAERISRLSRTVGAQVEVYGLTPAYGMTNVSTHTGAPYVSDFYRIRPVLRSYQAPDAAAKEVSHIY